MLVVCISGSNIKHAGRESTSYKTCELICDMVDKTGNQSKIIKLVDTKLKPCIGCGECYKKDKCAQDNEFNDIYRSLCKADAVFIVSAHYAPIPAKLSMVLEKIEQITFLERYNNENYRSPLYKKPIGIVGHGGGTEVVIEFYKAPVLDTICNALSYPVEMKIISIDNQKSKGVVFPVKKVVKTVNSIFPKQEYDWLDIKKRVEPLISKVLLEAER